jgi:hypothetical protein
MLHTQPPASVTQAIRCIWACLILTILSWVLLLFGPLPVPQDVIVEAEELGLSAHAFAIFNIVVLATFRAAIIYFVLNKLAKGRNWARFVCLIAASTEALHDTYHSFSHFGHDDATVIGTSFIITALHCALYGYAMRLLFTSAGKEWFQKNQPALSS